MPIRELSNAEYHSHLAISNSDLGAAAQSGQAFYDKKFGPKRESTKAFDVGTCFHSLVFPGQQPRVVVPHASHDAHNGTYLRNRSANTIGPEA